MASAAASDRLVFLSLEITGKCQLACTHCYADSGPHGTHGTMTTSDWMRVMDQAVELGAWHVGFVGGEPTLHPDLPALVEHALHLGLRVEVYSNLVRVTDPLWRTFQRPGVTLGTSYYSASAAEHDAITQRHSHDRSLANIREVVLRGIPLRIGVVRVNDGQRVDGAVEELRALGVTSISVDILREVGRGVRARGEGIDQLCGRCGVERVAVMPSGDVRPCLMSRWLTIGNVHEASLQEVYAESRGLRADLTRALSHPRADKCNPEGDGGCAAPVCLPHLPCTPDRKDG